MIVNIVEGGIHEIEHKQGIVQEEAGHLLYSTTSELADSIEGVEDRELEEIFGGHDFFHSALASVIKGEERKTALPTVAAYLFVNQILFYVLPSQAARLAGDETLYSLISTIDRFCLKRLRD